MFCPDAVAWGTVGEWVSGIGALAAVLFSVVIYMRERRDKLSAQAALQTREDQDRELARTRQARQVFVWRQPAIERYRDQGSDDGVNMHNGSDLPVFDVLLLGYSSRNGRAALEPEGDFQDMILPNDGFTSWSSGAPLQDHVLVIFRDANGARWARDAQGNLIENPDPDEMRKPHPPENADRASEGP
jgi:hypothetical protein